MSGACPYIFDFSESYACPFWLLCSRIQYNPANAAAEHYVGCSVPYSIDYTLMKHRVPTIYAKTVMGLLSGNEKLMLRPERKEEVENSIRKMIRAEIVINRRASAGYGFVYGSQRDKLELGGAFLPLYEKKSGFGYDVRVFPPLYEYAEILNGQFFTFSTRYMRVEGLSATTGNLAMIHCLLCRIGMISAVYGSQRLHAVASHSLLFDTMIKTPGIDMPDGKWYRERKVKTLWEQKMIPILRHFQSAGFIESFAEPSEGESVVIKR